MRVIAVFPFGKAANMIKSTAGVTKAKLIIDCGGPNCFWVASAKALSQIGHTTGRGRLFASVDDVANALGMPINNLWRIPNLSVGISYLLKLGVNISGIRQVSNLADIKLMLPFDGSVVMIVVKIMFENIEHARHAIYAYRDIFGRIRFFDRTVGAQFSGNITQGVFKTMNDIAPLYGATNIVAYEAAVIRNVFVKSVAFEFPRLVIPIQGIIATDNK